MAEGDYRTAIHDPAILSTAWLKTIGRAWESIGSMTKPIGGPVARIGCPALFLRSLRDDLAPLYSSVLHVWSACTTTQKGRGIDGGHHMTEEAPKELAWELLSLLRECVGARFPRPFREVLVLPTAGSLASRLSHA